VSPNRAPAAEYVESPTEQSTFAALSLGVEQWLPGSEERLELVSNEARRVELAPHALVTHREDGLPPVPPLETQGRAHDLLVVASLGVHVAGPWERGTGDRAVAEEGVGPGLVEVAGRVVGQSGAADHVGAGGVQEVLLGADTRGLHHVSHAPPSIRQPSHEDAPVSASSGNTRRSMPCAAASTTLASSLASVLSLFPHTGAKFTHPTVTTFSNCSYSAGIACDLLVGRRTTTGPKSGPRPLSAFDQQDDVVTDGNGAAQSSRVPSDPGEGAGHNVVNAATNLLAAARPWREAQNGERELRCFHCDQFKVERAGVLIRGDGSISAIGTEQRGQTALRTLREARVRTRSSDRAKLRRRLGCPLCPTMSSKPASWTARSSCGGTFNT